MTSKVELVAYWLQLLKDMSFFESRDIRLVNELAENRLRLKQNHSALLNVEAELAKELGEDWIDGDEFRSYLV